MPSFHRRLGPEAFERLREQIAAAAALCAYEFSKNVEKLEARCTLWVMFVYIAFQAALVILQDVYAVFDTGMLAYCVLFVFCIYLALFSGVGILIDYHVAVVSRVVLVFDLDAVILGLELGFQILAVDDSKEIRDLDLL